MKREIKATENGPCLDDRQKPLTDSLMDCVSEVVCVIDPNTYEILYANKTLRDMAKKDLTGCLCYEALHKNNSPCAFCTNDRLTKNSDRPLHREVHNSILKRDFSITSKIMQWPDGRDVIVECAIDITRNKKTEGDLKRRLEIERVVKDTSARFIGIHNFNDAIKPANPCQGFIEK